MHTAREYELPTAGREYAHFTFTGVPAGALLEAKVGDSAWTPLELVDGEYVLLVRGPGAPTDSGLLVDGTSKVQVRAVDSPEIVVRNAGIIRIV